jgi:NitT/TauT family transport system ATP-binding protein
MEKGDSQAAADSPEFQGLRIENLGITFNNTDFILRSFNLQVGLGEIIALVGSSGCGKSTLLRAIAGLQPHQAGEIEFVGFPARHSGNLSFVFQDPTLLPWRTVYENTALPLELHSSSRAVEFARDSWKQRIGNALSSVELNEETWQRFPRQLSGGMRMRVSIARSLVTDPDLLLLDEPFAALDDLLRTKLNELLLHLWDARKRTILFVTHNISEAIFLSHKIAVLGGGRLARLLDNPLPWPREVEQRTSLDFAKFYGQVSQALAEANQ